MILFYQCLKLIKRTVLLMLNNSCFSKCFYSTPMLFIFSLCGLSLLYSLILYCTLFNHTITIRKIISTRDDLTNEINKQKYLQTIPTAIIGNFIKVSLRNLKVGRVFEKYKRALPTQSEINESKKYIKDIPNFVVDDTGIVIKEKNKEGKEHPIQQDDKVVIDTDDGLQPVLLIPPGDEELNNNNLVPINDQIKSHNSHGSAQQKYDP